MRRGPWFDTDMRERIKTADVHASALINVTLSGPGVTPGPVAKQDGISILGHNPADRAGGIRACPASR